MKSKAVKEAAIELRKAGYSYSMIAEKTGLSKSTLYTWLAKVPYTPNKETVKRIGIARAQSGLAKHQLKLVSLQKANTLAKQDVGVMTKRDRLMFGLALYVGEGEKNDTVGITNSDVHIIIFMCNWLKEFYQVQNSNLRLAIHLYPDNNVAACLQYWSKNTGIPLEQFGKTQIDQRTNKGLGKRGKLQYGTAHLRVKSNGNLDLGVLLSRRILASTKNVLENK